MGHGCSHDTGIIDQAVKITKMAQRLSDKRIDLSLVCHIGLDAKQIRAVDFVGNLSERLFIDIDERDLRAPCKPEFCKRVANALSAAGDDIGSAFQSEWVNHDNISLLWLERGAQQVPITEMLHTFLLGKPPRLWVSPSFGAFSCRLPAVPRNCW